MSDAPIAPRPQRLGSVRAERQAMALMAEQASTVATTAEPDAATRCSHLVRAYRAASGVVRALDRVDIQITNDAFTVVAGPSGSGKSTLLRVLGLIEPPTSGRVVVSGTDVSDISAARRRRLRAQALVVLYQRPVDNLIEYLTAREQVVLAARLRGEAAPDVDALLGHLGLGHRIDQRPYTLSGGEQQRLAVATALATGAPLLLADEPTSQLDRASAVAVVDALRTARDLGATVVAASHDALVMDAADHLVRLESGRVTEVVR